MTQAELDQQCHRQHPLSEETNKNMTLFENAEANIFKLHLLRVPYHMEGKGKRPDKVLPTKIIDQLVAWHGQLGEHARETNHLLVFGYQNKHSAQAKLNFGPNSIAFESGLRVRVVVMKNNLRVPPMNNAHSLPNPTQRRDITVVGKTAHNRGQILNKKRIEGYRSESTKRGIIWKKK